MSDLVEEYKNKHIENYKMAISEIIKNNTNMLFITRFSFLIYNFICNFTII